jgi:hypothetical protein
MVRQFLIVVAAAMTIGVAIGADVGSKTQEVPPAPSAVTKPLPESLEDLRDIQKRVRQARSKMLDYYARRQTLRSDLARSAPRYR